MAGTQIGKLLGVPRNLGQGFGHCCLCQVAFFVVGFHIVTPCFPSLFTGFLVKEIRGTVSDSYKAPTGGIIPFYVTASGIGDSGPVLMKEKFVEQQAAIIDLLCT